MTLIVSWWARRRVRRAFRCWAGQQSNADLAALAVIRPPERPIGGGRPQVPEPPGDLLALLQAAGLTDRERQAYCAVMGVTRCG